jgi:FKBP-type peptidyl-prolyl cis-trans isomerase FklB
MKRTPSWLLVIAVSFYALSAQAVELTTDAQRLSYALGMMAVMSMKLEGATLDNEMVLQGVRDSLEGAEPALSRQEMFDAINQGRAMRKGATGSDAQESLTRGQDFLRRNKGEKGVVELPSGLQYRVLKEGNGKSPKLTDLVVAHYAGTLIDGTSFDSSYDRGQPATFGVDRVIPGWTEALQLMKEGAKWQLFIPSDLAYGPRAVGDKIPPNATLIFEVELIEVKAR